MSLFEDLTSPEQIIKLRSLVIDHPNIEKEEILTALKKEYDAEIKQKT